MTVTTPGGTSAISPADQFTFTAPAAITSASSTTFTEGTNGTFTVTATGTPAPALAESGTLPAGVTFDTGTGVLSGPATEAGSFPITFTATNGIGSPDNQSFTLTVNPPPLVISTTSLPGGTVGTAYAATLSATGGSGGNTWSIPSGPLPAGLSLDKQTGAISGTPTTPGAYHSAPR